MKKFLQKQIAVGLCVATLTSFTFTPPMVAFAAENAQQKTEEKSFLERYKAATEEQAPKVVPGNAYIPQGTVLKAELTSELSSKKAKMGDSVPLKLSENLIVNGVVVIPAGTEMEGTVTKAHKSGGLGQGGKLEFSITGVKTLNGVNVPLNFTKSERGAADAGAAAVFVAVSMVGGLFMKGKNVIYNPGTKFDAEVAENTDLNTPLENLAEAMNNDKPQGIVVEIK